VIKNIVVELDAPICSCPNPISVTTTIDTTWVLTIQCSNCKRSASVSLETRGLFKAVLSPPTMPAAPLEAKP
jgi:hypothetical protein